MQKRKRNRVWNIFFLMLICTAAGTVVSVFAEGAGDILFEEEFENRESVEGNGGIVVRNVEFKPGKFGNAAYIPAGQEIRFPVDGNIDLNEGTIEYWFQPVWVEKDNSFRQTSGGFSMFKLTEGKTLNGLRISHSGINWGTVKEIGVRFDENTPGNVRKHDCNLFGSCTGWQDGQWHKISVVYKLSGPEEQRYAALYLDEILQDSVRGVPVSVCDMGEWMHFLSGPTAVDRFRVYSVQKTYPQPINRNFIVNQGFELDENNDGLPDFWGQFGPAGTGYWGGAPDLAREERGINSRSNEQAFSGTWSAKMEGKADGVGGQLITGVQGITSGEKYQIDGAVNSVSMKQFSIYLRPCNHRGEVMQEDFKQLTVTIPEGSLNKWVLISDLLGEQAVYTAPENVRSVRIYFTISGKGVLFFDDLYFGEKNGSDSV